MIRRTQSFVVFILIMFNTILTFGQSISGKLLDTQTQTPQAGVQLLIENTDLQTFTNGAGSFKFENVKSGTYNILAKYNNQLFIVSTLDILVV